MTGKFEINLRLLPLFGPLEGKTAEEFRARHETVPARTLPGNMGKARRGESFLLTGPFRAISCALLEKEDLSSKIFSAPETSAFTVGKRRAPFSV